MVSSSVDRAAAERAARVFETHPEVLEVQLFGSVALNNQGNDLDLVLIVPRNLALHYLRLVSERRQVEREVDEMLQDIDEGGLPEAGPGFNSGYAIDEEVLCKALGDGSLDLLYEAAEAAGIDHSKFDILLLFPDWQKETALLSKIAPQPERTFWYNIAAQAQPISNKRLPLGKDRQPTLPFID